MATHVHALATHTVVESRLHRQRADPDLAVEAHALFHDTSYAATRQELSNDLKVKVDHVSHISATHAFQTGGAVPTNAAFSAKAKALVAGSATPSRRRARRLSAANMIGFGLAFANQTEPNGGSNSPHAHHRGSKAPSPRTALLAGRVDKGAQRGIDSEADVRDLWSVPRRQESRRTNVTGSTHSLHTAHSTRSLRSTRPGLRGVASHRSMVRAIDSFVVLFCGVLFCGTDSALRAARGARLATAPGPARVWRQWQRRLG